MSHDDSKVESPKSSEENKTSGRPDNSPTDKETGLSDSKVDLSSTVKEAKDNPLGAIVAICLAIVAPIGLSLANSLPEGSRLIVIAFCLIISLIAIFFFFLAYVVKIGIDSGQPKNIRLFGCLVVSVASFVGFVSTVLVPVFSPSRVAYKKINVSLSNLKQIGIANSLYTADNEDSLPVANKWVDSLYVYTKGMEVFRRPDTTQFGYASNLNLSSKNVYQIESVSESILEFESKKESRNASDRGESCLWKDGKAFCAFADGSAGQIVEQKANFDFAR